MPAPRDDGIVVNLLDTPGYPDFTGELRAGLRAADAALFVVSAAEDIDPITSTLWEECAALGTPRAVVMTRLDTPRAYFDARVAACQRVFGGADGQDVLPLYLPVAHEPETAPEALVGLLSRRVYDYAAGFPPKVSDLSDDVDVAGDVEQARNALIEAIINNSEDESLLDRYLAGEDIGVDVLIDDLETAVARGTFYPVVPVCAATGLGLGELLEIIGGGFPSPVELDPPAVTTVTGAPANPLRCDPAGPLLGEVVRTSVDPYQGRLSILRIFSGTLTPDSAIHISGHGGATRGHPDHDADERVGQLFSPVRRARCARSTRRSPVTSARSAASASPRPETPCRTRPRRCSMRPWSLPEPLLPIAVQAATRGDEDALAKALGRLTAGDPTVRVERSPDTGQLVLWCLGEAHADVVLDRLRATGARVDTVPVRIAAARDVHREARGSRPAGQAVRRARAVRGLRRRGHHRSLAVRASSSPRRSSAARCRPSSSARSRRACARSSSTAWTTTTSRWSTCWSRSSTARRTASTPPTPPSRWPARSR